MTSAISVVPGALAYTWLGYAGRQAVTGGENLMRDLFIAIGVLAAVALLPRRVRRLRGQARFIDCTELQRRLENGTDTVVIDVRTPQEFVGPLGYIPGACNIPVDELSASLERIEEMKHTSIVMVCKTDKRSAKGAALLKNAGFEQVSVLRGGMEDWKRGAYRVGPQRRE